MAVTLGLATGATLAPLGASAGASPPLGTWTELTAGLPVPLGNTPSVVQLANGRGYVLWLSREPGNKQTYYFAALTPHGAVATPPASVFGTGYWGELSWEPTLVAGDESEPIVIFQGSRSLKKGDVYGDGCVVSAEGAKVPWILSPFSLTNPCVVVPIGGATEMKGEDEFSAEEVGGNHLYYLLHQEPGVPPSPKLPHDSSFALPNPGTASFSAETTDLAGNGDAYAAWMQVFAKGVDGLYVKDLTANGPTRKAPGSGEHTAEAPGPPVWSKLAFASTNSHPGVFLAYCSNTPTCNVLLWRVGAAKAMSTPAVGLSGNIDPALAAGPGGRLWLAWYYTNKSGTIFVSIVRTNQADTAFGPVASYPTSCWGYPPLIGLGGGSWGRLDVAVQCTVNKPKITIKDFVTQTMVPVDVSPTSASFDNLKAHSVTFKVTDVGDPVPGATVAIPGKGLKATTGPGGEATITFPAGMAAGHYTIIAAAPNYLPAHATVVVTLPVLKKLGGH